MPCRSVGTNTNLYNKTARIFFINIMKAEGGIASLLADSDWSNKRMNTFSVHGLMKSGNEELQACLQIPTGATRE